MPLAARIRSSLRALFRRSRSDSEMDAELRFHIESRAADLVREGVLPAEALRRARLEFGAVNRAKEECRESGGLAWLHSLAQDVRFGLRTLRKSPGFTIVAVLTLALGIGANTAIFSMVDAELLRALPVKDPQRLVVFKWTAYRPPNLKGSYWSMSCPGDELGGQCVFSHPMFHEFQLLTNLFSGVAAIGGWTQVTLTGNGAARNASGELVSGNFFRTLGVSAALGRTLGPSDDLPGASPVAVLSYDCWQSQFGANPAAVGKTVELNRVPVTIVGVIARTFPDLAPGSHRDMWLPLALQPQLVGENGWYGSQGGEKPSLRAGDDVWWIYVLARLKPAVSLARANAAADAIFRGRVLRTSADAFTLADAPRLVLMPAPEAIVGNRAGLYQPLMILMFSVGVILLIACANVAGLVIARSAARQKEIAIRLALGARRVRIVRQLLTESIMLSIAGGVAGALLAYWTSRASIALIPIVDLDSRVLVFAAGVAIVSGIAFGLLPAFRWAGADLTHALKEHIAGSARATRGSWLSAGSALVVGQVALSVVALAGAGLLVRTLANLESINPGFDARNLLLFGIDPTLQGYSDARCRTLYTDLRERLSHLPQVISVSYSFDTLLSDNLWSSSVHIDGDTQKQDGETDALAVGPHFTQTMGIPLLAGRVLSEADFAPSTSARAVLVNQSFARDFFGRINPLGRFFDGICGKARCEIVGVVSDAKYKNLRSEMTPTAYVPQESGSTYFEIRTAGNPRSVISAVRAAVEQLDSNLPVYGIQTQQQLIDTALFPQRQIARLSSSFGLLDLLLACIGLYGLVAYSVASRTHEIGIRMALGAQKAEILGLVLVRGLKLTLLGVTVGVAGALGLTGFLSSLLYGVKSSDPLTLAAASLFLTCVALLACYIPARRAMRVDPLTALRHE